VQEIQTGNYQKEQEHQMKGSRRSGQGWIQTGYQQVHVRAWIQTIPRTVLAPVWIRIIHLKALGQLKIQTGFHLKEQEPVKSRTSRHQQELGPENQRKEEPVRHHLALGLRKCGLC
jgi:hypothetical protein